MTKTPLRILTEKVRIGCPDCTAIWAFNSSLLTLNVEHGLGTIKQLPYELASRQLISAIKD